MALRVTSKDGFYGWVNLAVVFFFYIAVMLMMVSFGVFLKYWLQDFSWSAGWTSGAQQLSMILSGLAAPLVGRYIMKRGSKRAIIIGNVLNVAGLVLLAYLNELWELYLGYGVLVGLGLSIGGMLAVMTVINNWFIMKRSIALAVSMAGMGFSGTVMIPGLVRMIEYTGWRNTYLFIAAFVTVFCIIIPGLFLKNRPEDLGQVPDGPAAVESESGKQAESSYRYLYKTQVEFTAGEAMRTRTLWLLVVYGTLLFLVMNALVTHHYNFLCSIGLSEATASYAVGFFSAVMAVSQLGIGVLGLRFRMQSLAALTLGIGVVGYIMLLTAERHPEHVYIVFIYCFLLGIAFGIQAIAMGNLFPDYFGRTEFPKIMGYTMPITTLFSSFGATAAGFILDKTGVYTLAFQLSLGAMIAALICMLFAKPPLHPSLKSGSGRENADAETQPAPIISE